MLWQGGFSESTPAGGPQGVASPALRYDAQSQVSVPLTLGTRVGRTFDLGNGHVLAATAELGWVHEFQPQRALTASFVEAPDVPFRVMGIGASRDAAETSVGASLTLSRRVSVFGSFTGQFSGIETAYGGSVGVHVAW